MNYSFSAILMLPAKTPRTEQAASDAERFRQIVNAAAQAFALAGYHRTQMADIAAGAKVALGSLYRHTESKEELFASAMALGVGLDPAAVIGERPIGGIENYLARRMPDWFGGDLSARVAPKHAELSLATMLGEFYDIIAERRIAIRILDRSAHDLPRLGELYFLLVRAPAMRVLTHCLERLQIAGRIAPLPHVTASARLIIETCAWFAMHRLYSPGGADIPEDVARYTALTHLCRGFGAMEEPP